MGAPEQVVAAYPFGPEWKAAADRKGAEWRRYAEATKCLQRYFVTKARLGKEAAVLQFRAYCARILKGSNDTHAVEQLQEDFILVGIYEGTQIETESKGMV